MKSESNDPSQRKYLTKKELKFISAYNEPTKSAPIIPITPLPRFDPPKPRDLRCICLVSQRSRKVSKEKGLSKSLKNNQNQIKPSKNLETTQNFA